jgi:hypothetical protein
MMVAFNQIAPEAKVGISGKMAVLIARATFYHYFSWKSVRDFRRF